MSDQEPIIWNDTDINRAWKAGYIKALDHLLEILRENLDVHKKNVKQNPHLKNKDLKVACIVLAQVVDLIEVLIERAK